MGLLVALVLYFIVAGMRAGYGNFLYFHDRPSVACPFYYLFRYRRYRVSPWKPSIYLVLSYTFFLISGPFLFTVALLCDVPGMALGWGDAFITSAYSAFYESPEMVSMATGGTASAVATAADQGLGLPPWVIPLPDDLDKLRGIVMAAATCWLLNWAAVGKKVRYKNGRPQRATLEETPVAISEKRPSGRGVTLAALEIARGFRQISEFFQRKYFSAICHIEDAQQKEARFMVGCYEKSRVRGKGPRGSKLFAQIIDGCYEQTAGRMADLEQFAANTKDCGADRSLALLRHFGFRDYLLKIGEEIEERVRAERLREPCGDDQARKVARRRMRLLASVRSVDGTPGEEADFVEYSLDGLGFSLVVDKELDIGGIYTFELHRGLGETGSPVVVTGKVVNTRPTGDDRSVYGFSAEEKSRKGLWNLSIVPASRRAPIPAASE